MIDWTEKVRVRVGEVSLELPAVVAGRQDSPIDSAAHLYAGGGVTVIVDQGPFADRLANYAGSPEYKEEIKNIAGRPTRLVSFRDTDSGTYTVATHLPSPDNVTVVVKAEASVPERVSREIFESLRLRD